MEELKQRYKPILVIIFIITIIGLFTNVWAGAKVIISFGFSPAKILVYFFSIVLYISILKFTRDFFKYESKTTITSMLMRFVISTAVFLIGISSRGKLIVCLCAVILILVPFMAGDLTKTKRNIPIIISVLAVTLALGILRIVLIPNTILPYVASDVVDRIVYYFLSFNQFLQWGLFSLLYFLKYKYFYGKQKENE